MYNSILLEKKAGVATIAFNRPDVYNAFNNEMSFELQAALKDVGMDETIRVVVLTGNGKAFCSGQDLKATLEDEPQTFTWALENRYNPVIRTMRQMSKPIIGKLNGVAAGAGCSLALACDMIIASEHASMIEVFVNIGLVVDSGSSYFLPRLVGSAKAFEMATMGTKLKADDALKFGLVNKVVAAEELDAAVKTVTDYYVQAPTYAIGLMKKMLNRSFDSDLDQMLDYETFCQELAGQSEDFQEGVSAFLEKRRANFKGR